MFALAATYIANLLTKWGEINIEEGLSPEDGQEVPGMSDSVRKRVGCCSYSIEKCPYGGGGPPWYMAHVVQAGI
jgi:hypothetical protein